MSNEGTNWRDTIICLICIVFIFFIIIVASRCDDREIPPTKPNKVNVDSLLNTNDSIKVVITYIDSVKNEEIQQVLKLDNDSTLELFKQLVRE